MKYVLPFSDITFQDVTRFGGKAASLGEMVQGRFLIPNGFGINIEAHREFADKPFTSEFKDELHHALDALNVTLVAVRSSAVAEDSVNASWAGQLETFLNVERDHLEQRVRDCWKSVEAKQVKDYAKDKSLSGDALLVGVVVQAMVEADAAGVMFTANPVTNNRSELLIEAAYGLGEMVVQGAVTPDNFTVDAKTNQVTHFGINVKERMMVYREGKNEILDVPDEIADRAVLREAQVQELAEIGVNIARHYDKPQDIEWCLKDGTFYVVQARPITTLIG